MKTKQRSIAQRSQDKLYFDHKDMDHYLSWIIGRQIYDGSDAWECFDVASRIADGDAQSWQSAWRSLAERVEEQAQTTLGRGDVAGARAAYLRACTYYRAPLFIMQPQASAFHHNWQKMQTCFQQAAVLFDPPIERIHVPFQGHLMPGYLWKVDQSDQKRPILVVFGGIETFAEDCYFMTGPAGPQRGYNVLTVDLPGQGVNPDYGLFFRARMELPVQAAIDYALSRPEVDAERLAVFGFSWGDILCSRAVNMTRASKP